MSFKKILFIIISFSVCAYAVGVYTTGSIATGWRTNGANDVMIKSDSDACHRADSAGYDYFIPSATPTEWSAVNAHKPAGLAITACVCEPLLQYACPITNGTGERQCWSNGANWNACVANGCNAGYTLTAGVCVVNPPPHVFQYYTGARVGGDYFGSLGHSGDPQAYDWRIISCRDNTLGGIQVPTNQCIPSLGVKERDKFYWVPSSLPAGDTTTYEVDLFGTSYIY